MRLDPIAVEAGVRLEALAVTESTNAEARLRARAGESGPLWITAVEQTRGRGRRGRFWISPPGNLYASLLLSNPSQYDCAPELAFVAALAVRDAIITQAPALAPKLRFKWPNDLLLSAEKCAGILIEGETGTEREGGPDSRLTVIVGIGVNCTTHPTPSSGSVAVSETQAPRGKDVVFFPATDLLAQGTDVTPRQLFQSLSATMCRRIAQWDRGCGFPTILGDWLSSACGIGEKITVRDGGTELHGRFVGLDQSGRLVLGLADGGLKKISAGDVFPISVHDWRRIWSAWT
jgi:BirA family biotin operon repressor/biotin-[acetyl-CoA-carboxylase] ligase